MARIFISYSRTDEVFARRIAASLSDLGADVWIDVEDIPAGMKWSTAIQQGLNLCEAMLVVVSPESMASSNVEDEWQFYLDKGNLIIPLLWRPAEVHFQLNRVQYVDFHTQAYGVALEQLYGELARHNIPLNPISSFTGLSDSMANLSYQQPLPVSADEDRGFSRIGLALGGISLILIVSAVVLLSNLTGGDDGETHKVFATLSGGGRGQIMFSSDPSGIFVDGASIMLYDVVGDSLLRVTDDTFLNIEASWSPDGSQIVFASDREGDREIYIMDADGNNLRQLTQNQERDSRPAWSPDGSQIVFESDRDGNWEIYIMHTDGNNQQRLTEHQSRDSSPSWSPDGSQIAFASDREGDNDLYIMDASGVMMRQLTQIDANDDSPAWSPDGTQIAFISERDGNRALYVMDVGGSGIRQLTQGEANVSTPSWSPDSSQIAFTSPPEGIREVYVVDVDEGDIRRLTDSREDKYFPVWQP